VIWKFGDQECTNELLSEGRVFPTGTVTMLFTDIEGSTRLLKQLGKDYGALLDDHRRLLREAFAAHEGREMDTQGDAFFVAFSRAANAALAAADGQRALAAHAWPEGAECRVRMGLHTGEPNVGQEGYHGLGLHRGARIMAAGHGGQILLSNATRELIHDDLPRGITLRDLGLQQLKDIDRPEHLYQLVVEGLPADFPPLKTAQAPPPRKRRRRTLAAAAAVVVVLGAGVGAFLSTRGGGNEATAGTTVSADAVGILDPSSGRLKGDIPVGASPSAIAAGAGSLWVANNDAHTVSRVDPGRGVMIDTIPVGNGPAGIAFGGGALWVTNSLDGTVTQIDPDTNTPLPPIRVGSAPTGIAVDSRYVWVANSNDSTVTRIDLRTGKPLAPIAVPGGADGVAIGFGSVWVTSQGAGTVTRIDERTGALVQPIQSGGGADAVTTGLGSVWVANDLEGTVTRIDPATNTVTAVIHVGEGPNAVAVADGSVWVSNELDGTLSRIDPARNVAAPALTTGNRPEGIVPADGRLFVAVRASGTGHRGGTLTVLEDGRDVPTLDPAIAGDAHQTALILITSDGLVAYRRVGGIPGGKLVSDLAVSLPLPTDAGRTYSFRLRPGIRYSTGALLRPEDFRRGLERTLSVGAGTGALATPALGEIVGGQRCLAEPHRPCDLSRGVVADRTADTVTIHLTRADPTFLYQLPWIGTFPVPPGTPMRPTPFVPGTGPYRIASFDTRGAKLVRNRFFHEWSRAAQPDGNPDVIRVRFGGTADSRISAVLRGRADLASWGSVPSQPTLESLRTRQLGRLRITPWYDTWFLALNTKAAPFDNVLARRALNFAIDRMHLRDLTLGQGLGQVTCQVLPPDLDGYSPYCPYTVAPNSSGTWTAPDLARARALVRRSGTTGKQVTVWIPHYIGFSAAPGRYVVSVLDSLGYHARLRIGRQRPSSERVGFWVWTPNFASAAGFIPSALGCDVSLDEGNESRFCDPAIDREMARAQSLARSDPVQANTLWTRIDHELTDEGPWVPYANRLFLEVVSKRVGNYQWHPQWSTLLDQLWVR
jgi:YVTN family beta-propeller protein